MNAVGGATGSKWEKYLEIRYQICDIEASLAEEWFSTELMTKLRSEIIRDTITGKRKKIATGITSQIIWYLKKGSLNCRNLADLVNFIRQNPEDFDEWHSSETSQLFSPPVFRNSKKSSGYFF